MVVWSNVLELNKDHSQCHPHVMAFVTVPREGHGDDPGHLSLLLTLLANQQFCWCVTVFNNHDTHMTLALRLALSYQALCNYSQIKFYNKTDGNQASEFSH